MAELKIGILNAHNTLNYGSMIMCENMIHYLSKLLHNAYFVILSNFVEETESRIRNAIRFDKIEVRPRTASFHVKKVQNGISILIDQVLFRYRNLIKQLNDCKVIIVLGGDDISEYYGIIRLLDILLRLRYLKRARKKIYLLGQSIGPMQSWRIGLARKVLGRMDKIYHRDPISYSYVTEILGVKGNSFLFSDLAFLDLPRQNGEFDIEKYDIQRQRYITFVPSGLWSLYCGDYMRYFEGLLNITNYLPGECKKGSMKLVLLPHILRTSDDRTLVKQMVAAGISIENIVAVTGVLLPYEARAILRSSYFVVTQRVHGAISSLQAGVPALSLSYSKKFSGIIGSYLGLPELVVEIRKAHFGEDIDKVYSAIDRGLQDATGFKAKIEKAVIKAKRDAMVQIEDLAKDMIS
jgi:colanic acid/amylovoran biosynthesis protein